MRHTLPLAIDDVMPPRRAVLAHQGIPADAVVSARILRLHQQALEEFAHHARPVGLLDEVDGDEFEGVFEGEGRNAHDAVVGELWDGADRLALYAATIGEGAGDRIEELFAAGDFALGAMLDSVASMAAERAAEALAGWYGGHLVERGVLAGAATVLGYSPGYCGWHITGQRRLFARLQPASIGISLSDSYMMRPLKSVSGVLLAAHPRVHLFSPRFSYCPDCRQRSCIGRLQPLRAALRGT